ncbi:MAG TPA: biopolymer transporter ExbD [Gammaproteobacteria bacterium]|nr:biopolymer transporter ExbD [Gammaproteobacteria bacterium]
MNFQSQRRDEVELNITPLIDVVFLLLIFFMVSTTFERESEINITLPEASKDITEAKPDAIRIAIDAESRIYINDRALINSQLTTIKQGLSDALKNLQDAPVIISADASTSHQMVVKVMDAARQLGLVRITFATQKIDEEE